MRLTSTAALLAFGMLGISSTASPAQSGNAQPNASDSLRKTLSNLAHSIGSSGVEMYMSGTEFAHEQARDPHMPIQTVPAKERFQRALGGSDHA